MGTLTIEQSFFDGNRALIKLLVIKEKRGHGYLFEPVSSIQLARAYSED